MTLSIDYEEIAEEIFREQNEVRKNPQGYIEKLQNSLKYYKDNILYKDYENPIKTSEGAEAVKDAINFLKNQKPVQELIYSKDIGLSGNFQNNSFKNKKKFFPKDDKYNVVIDFQTFLRLNYEEQYKDLIDDIGPKGLVTHEGTEIKNIYNRLEQYCDWDGVIAENIDFGFKIPENIVMNMIIDDGDENRYQRLNLFYPEFKYVGIAVGPHKEFEFCTVIEYAYNIREIGTDYLNVDEFINKYRKLYDKGENKNKDEIKNPFQEGDADAPDNTISLRVEKEEKEIEGQIVKITKKIFSLDDDTQHIVEFRGKNEKE